MRLTTEQVDQFHQVISRYWETIPYELYLYGSRVHDHLKGGDIDLLILTPSLGVSLFQTHELEILVEIKKMPSIGQRRIDIKVATQEQLKSEPFLQAISDHIVKL